MDPAARAEHLLALHRPGDPLLAPNPWDPGSARLLESLGFQALCTTSSGAAATQAGLDGPGREHGDFRGVRDQRHAGHRHRHRHVPHAASHQPNGRTPMRRPCSQKPNTARR